MAGRGAGSELIERERELRALAVAVERACAGAGTAVLIEGEPGIGKTVLLDRAGEMVRAQGGRVMCARGAALERQDPLGVLASLLRSAARWPGPAAAAAIGGIPAFLRGLLGGGSLSAPPVEPSRLVYDAVFRLVEELCETAPVAVCLDDAHWADRASLVALAHIAHRVDQLPLAVVVARRSPGTGRPWPAGQTGAEEDRFDLDVLAPLADAAATVHVKPAALSAGGTRALVGRRVGEQPPATLDVLQALTGGNPLLVTHVARSLAAGGTARDPSPRASATVIAGIVLDRLLAASSDARAVARAVAILGDGSSLAAVAALAELAPDAAIAAAVELEQVAIFSDRESLSFSHPLLGETVRADLGGHARELLHLRAAQVLRACGAEPASIAAQVMRSPPSADPDAVGDLRRAAVLARARAGPAAAVALLERAVAEPPPAAVRAAVEVELGQAQLAAGDPAAALERLERTLHDPEWPAGVVLGVSMATALSAGFDAAVAAMLDAAGARERAAPDAALLLRGAAAYLAWFLPPAQRPSIALPSPDTLSGATPGERMALTGLVSQRANYAHVGDHVAELASRALADGRMVTDSPLAADFAVSPLLVLVYAERLDHAAHELAVLDRVAFDQVWPGAVVLGRLPAVLLALTRGELTTAIADGEALLGQRDLLQGPVLTWLGSIVSGLVLLAELARDGAEAADQRLAALGLDGELPPERLYAAGARAHVHLARKRPQAALADARLWQAASEAIGSPVSPIDYAAALPAALAACGATAEARAEAELALERARRWGARGRIAAALRITALTDPDRAMARLREAHELLADSTLRLERARVLHDLGVLLRRAGRRGDARAAFQEAVQDAADCGAQPLIAAGLKELRILGVRPRRLAFSGRDSLTASEQRVAELAADGASNRDIAERLFVTVKTVDSHLMRAYRKLGISSRRELAAELSSDSRETSGSRS